MDSFKDKVRCFFWPAVLFFGILLIGSLIFRVIADDPVISSKLTSPPIQPKSPSESIDTNKPKSPPIQPKSPSESIDTNKPKRTPTPSKSTNANSLSVAFFIVLLILLAVSILTNVLFFKWRFRANDKQRSFVPEVLIDSANSIVNDLAKKFKDMAKQHSANIDQSKRASKNTEKLFHDLIESFTDLQAALNKRDKEIERLKKGYDSEVFRKFLTRFIRVDKALCDEIHAAAENSDHRRNFERIQGALRDAFEDCGVSTFSPKIGGHLREASGVAENPKTKPTSSQKEDFTIAEVTEPGFKLQVQEGPDQCLKPAKVIVYRFSKGD